MKPFKNFSEPIFYKNYSELELQIEALNKLKEIYPNNYEVAQKLKICKLGLAGEKEIEFELKNSNIGMYVLHDINLEYEDLKAQIDYIIITPAYVYFIECKNLIGNIRVNSSGEFTREYFFNGKNVKEGLYSPIRQSERHKEVFKKIWKSKNTTFIDKTLRKNMVDKWYKTLFVSTNSKSILNLKSAPKEIRDKIVRADLLVEYINKDIKNCDKNLLNSQKEMHSIAFTLMNDYNKIIEKDYEKEFLNLIESSKKNSSCKKDVVKFENDIDQIKKKLIAFRKEKSMAQHVPAYYIFNNKELDEILNVMPVNLQELKASKILSDVKFNLHGKDIIENMYKEKL